MNQIIYIGDGQWDFYKFQQGTHRPRIFKLFWNVLIFRSSILVCSTSVKYLKSAFLHLDLWVFLFSVSDVLLTEELAELRKVLQVGRKGIYMYVDNWYGLCKYLTKANKRPGLCLLQIALTWWKPVFKGLLWRVGMQNYCSEIP